MHGSMSMSNVIYPCCAGMLPNLLEDPEFEDERHPGRTIFMLDEEVHIYWFLLNMGGACGDCVCVVVVGGCCIHAICNAIYPSCNKN